MVNALTTVTLALVICIVHSINVEQEVLEFASAPGNGFSHYDMVAKIEGKNDDLLFQGQYVPRFSEIVL